MPEREVVVDKVRLTYEGLFSVQDLYKLLDNFFRNRGYDKRERRNIENVKPEGKYIELELEPWKKITDYASNVIKVRVIMSTITDAEIEKEGVKINLNQGKVQFVFDAYLETDYEARWEGKPLFYFLRTVFNKYIFKPFTDGYQNNVMADFNELYSEVKAFLNVYRTPAPAVTAPRAVDTTPTP